MSPAQQEQLLTIGSYLKSIREDQGKAVDEVANQIFIRPALVRAIETGDWGALPEPVFVQGFIRRYADYLGLDGLEVADQFEPTPVSVLPDPKLAARSTVDGVVNQQDRHGLKVLSRGESQVSSSAVTPGNQFFRWQWILGLGAIAAIGGAVWVATQGPERTAATPPNSDISTTSASQDGDTTGTAVELPGTTEAVDDAVPGPVEDDTAGASDAEAITLQVNLEGDSWMRVIVDGEEVYEGILTSGTQETWTAENELKVTAGNSGAVLYSLNGGSESPLGAPGAVRNLTLTPDTDPQVLQTQ